MYDFYIYTVIPRYNIDFGASQKSMLYQNPCYIELYLKYKEKYYLYRLHKVSEDEYILSILQNPLADNSAIEQSIYVNLDKSKNKEVFEVSGGQ